MSTTRKPTSVQVSKETLAEAEKLRRPGQVVITTRAGAVLLINEGSPLARKRW